MVILELFSEVDYGFLLHFMIEAEEIVYMCIHIEEFEVRLGVRRDDLEEVRLKGKKVE